MTEVRRVKLPGVGVLHTFYPEDGGKVGVVAHRSGANDLIAFADIENPDEAVKISLRLTEDEAHTLAELLGGTQITESLHALDQIPGLSIDWFTVDYDDDIAGKPLGKPADHGFVGVTVVAVVRGDEPNPAPGIDFKVWPGDTLVVAGSPEKVAKAFAYFRTGSLPATSAIDTQAAPGTAAADAADQPER
jgi:TrkA domain protein